MNKSQRTLLNPYLILIVSFMNKEIFLIITEDVEPFLPVEEKPLKPDYGSVTAGSAALDEIYIKNDVTITKFVESDYWTSVPQKVPELMKKWEREGHEIGLHIHFFPRKWQPAKVRLAELRKNPAVYYILDKIKEFGPTFVLNRISPFPFYFENFNVISSRTQSIFHPSQYDAAFITELFEYSMSSFDDLGEKPVSFRAGSFGMSYPLLSMMEKYQFKNSSNLVPRVVFKKLEKNVDYFKPYMLSNDLKEWYHPRLNEDAYICPKGKYNYISSILEVPPFWHQSSSGNVVPLYIDSPFLLKKEAVRVLKSMYHDIKCDPRDGPFFIVLCYHSWACGVKQSSKHFIKQFDRFLNWCVRGDIFHSIIRLKEVRDHLTS